MPNVYAAAALFIAETKCHLKIRRCKLKIMVTCQTERGSGAKAPVDVQGQTDHPRITEYHPGGRRVDRWVSEKNSTLGYRN